MALWKRLLGLKTPPPEWFSALAAHNEIHAPNAALTITYLGTAGFVIANAERTLVLDPYLSRPNLRKTLSAPLQPDTALIKATLPHADDVLVGHAHYDHILDAPDLCHQTGARLVGSGSTVMVGRAAGLPEAQLRETAGHEDIASGAWVVRGVPSQHGLVFGRIPMPGDITEPPAWPARIGALKHGLVLNWWIHTGGLRVVHIDSADFIHDELKDLRCDVLCLCAIGRQNRPNYVRDAIAILQPRWVIPCHWDTMMTPLHSPPDLIPGVDLPGMVQEIIAAGSTPLLTPILGKVHFQAPR